MRILMIHNYYQMRGGEDISFESEAELLRAHGHDVFLYTKDNSDIDRLPRLLLAQKVLWNQAVYREVRALIRKVKPDIVHCQNIFPLISPSVYYAAKAEKCRVAQSLRNYRLVCPSATLFRNQHICEECLGQKFCWRAVVYRCYRRSFSQSLGAVTVLALHHLLGTWDRMIDGFIASSDFSRKKFIQAGMAAEKIHLKPALVFPAPGPVTQRGDYALFVGRVAAGKGIPTLLRAWLKNPQRPLKIVGAGPSLGWAREFVLGQKLTSVEILGQQDHETVIAMIQRARFLIFPSEWYETFGRAMLEAAACGVPVLAARVGTITEILEEGKTGIFFQPGDCGDLAQKLDWVWQNEEKMQGIGKAAREMFEAKYSPGQNCRKLVDIYAKILDVRSHAK